MSEEIKSELHIRNNFNLTSGWAECSQIVTKNAGNAHNFVGSSSRPATTDVGNWSVWAKGLITDFRAWRRGRMPIVQVAEMILQNIDLAGPVNEARHHLTMVAPQIMEEHRLYHIREDDKYEPPQL